LNKLLIVLLAALLGGCFTLPGSEAETPTRYALQGPAHDCVGGNRSIAVSIVRVASGLDTDRIARLREPTGEFSYLRNLRWVDSAGAMVEQRLATDLECRGFVVQTGHRTRTGQGELLCELRALEVRETGQDNTAVVALSCTYQDKDGAERALVESAQRPLAHWNATAAVQALGVAYGAVFDKLFAALTN
jgi:ABC-type uncharacterized transport system auxiliary subunit